MLKKLLQSVREYKKDSILSPVFVTFEVIMEVIIPLLMAKLIDLGIEKGSMSNITKWGDNTHGLLYHFLDFRSIIRKTCGLCFSGIC